MYRYAGNVISHEMAYFGKVGMKHRFTAGDRHSAKLVLNGFPHYGLLDASTHCGYRLRNVVKRGGQECSILELP